MENSIPVESFYGKVRKVIKVPASGPENNTPSKFVIKSLLNGPDTTWRVYKRQAEAIEFAKKRSGSLMVFAFEDSNSIRLFLVANPEVFWHYDSQRRLEERNSYEVIQEYFPCKLYFDLEFDRTINPDKDGLKMVDLFLKIIIHFLKDIWQINVSKKEIIVLDSSTPRKFSHHLIFDCGAVFQNNSHCGNFVQFVSSELEKPNGLAKWNLNPDELFVMDSKGGRKLFFDSSVYSKNRHFRLYGSSKGGQNRALIIGELNEFRAESELSFFLSSLISYITDIQTKQIMVFGQEVSKKGLKMIQGNRCAPTVSSPYQDIDNFINQLVSPGRIYRSVFFAISRAIVYDIVGNRFCGNIGRQHKSQNIKYIVDLSTRKYYQKCHDIDCREYKSEGRLLPVGLGISDDWSEDELDSDTISELLDTFQPTAKPASLQRFPSFGLSDEDIIEAVDNII